MKTAKAAGLKPSKGGKRHKYVFPSSNNKSMTSPGRMSLNQMTNIDLSNEDLPLDDDLSSKWGRRVVASYPLTGYWWYTVSLDSPESLGLDPFQTHQKEQTSNAYVKGKKKSIWVQVIHSLKSSSRGVSVNPITASSELDRFLAQSIQKPSKKPPNSKIYLKYSGPSGSELSRLNL